jgi:hypothetical protein
LSSRTSQCGTTTPPARSRMKPATIPRLFSEVWWEWTIHVVHDQGKYTAKSDILNKDLPLLGLCLGKGQAGSFQ